MRETRDLFHLAIPARDLEEAVTFYVGGLGCKLARRYEDRITLDFFGDQLVCHLSDRYEHGEVELYPRHFGVSFADRDDFDALLHVVELREILVFRPCGLRFEGLAEEHLTIVLRDPSNNLLEFKHYLDRRMAY